MRIVPLMNCFRKRRAEDSRGARQIYIDPLMSASPSTLSTAQLDALVAAASADDARRALRIVLGADHAYWERDLQSGAMWYSPSFFRTLGLPQTQDRDRINARIHPDDRASFASSYAAALEGGGSFSYDVRYLDEHDAYRWARAFGRVWLDDGGVRSLRLIGTMIDVHAERQARLDADAYARLYQRALDASSEAHFERTEGADDFSLSANFAQLLGHPAGTPPPDRLGFMALVHAEDQPALRDAVQRAWQEPGAWSATYRLRLADGGWRWFRGRGRTERDAQGRLRMSGMIGDVQQQELDRRELDQHRHHLRAMVAERTDALNAALEEARAQRREAERASSAKSEFLAHMSHELRTPLNGLLGLTDLALQSAEQPAQRRYLEVALRSGRGLLQVIDEVLDLSRLEAGAIELENRPFDLSELLAEVLRTLMAGAAGKPLSLRYDFVGDGARVVGDAARVRQVTTNLVANAIKFTTQGHVALTCEVANDGSGALRATVRVEDSGPGIAPALHERIFEPFVQADASLTRQHGGSGLGLAIARRMAQAMGGAVVLERSSSAGSVFAFSWPVVIDARLPAATAPPSGHAWLVFRRDDSAQWLQRRIERFGWSGARWPDVAAAVAHAQRTAPREHPQVVIVSDQALDAQTDFAALRAALPGARVVLLVRPDWHEPALERAANDQGVTPALLPLTPNALHAVLGGRATAPKTPTSSAPTAAAPAARVLVVEDNAVNLMITEEFVRQLGHEPHGAADGAAAIAACERQPPHLVLMDLQMPVMDGFEATRRLRALQTQGRLPAFPIIALTAHAGEADRRQGSAAGMDDYLTKPILIDALRASFARWLG
jgi:signal transduction histidine kinase/CheY-like chemotaxis protein